VDPLIEKVLNNLIKKNATLKKDDMLSSLLVNTTTSAPTTAATAATTTTSTSNSADSTEDSTPSTIDDNKHLIANVEARLLGNKALTEPLKKSALEFEMLLLAPEQRKAKRKTITTEQRTSDKRSKPSTSTSTSTKPSPSVGSSSLFMESLGGDDQQQGNDGKTKARPAQGKKDAAPTDWEDPDFEKYYNGGAPEKQNRPGQRQRRM
jgi:hypothetical protein